MEIFNKTKSVKDTNFELTKKLKQTTELNIADFMHGINPREIYRNSSDCLINIFYREKITKKKLENLFNSYGEKILIEYLNDLYIRNKSILTRNSYGIMEDHVNIYDEKKLGDIIKKYFKDEDLSEEEEYILMGIFQKCAEMLDVYKYRNMMKYEKYVKAEINLGIFQNIVVEGKKYRNKERKTLVKLAMVWNRDTLSKYENLELLKDRFMALPNGAKFKEEIENIQNMEYQRIIKNSNIVKKAIERLYLEYEVSNRQAIINNAYMPVKSENKDVIIDDLSKMEEGAILHFFGIYTKVFSLENYLYKLEKEYGRKLSPDEKKSARKSFESKSNTFITHNSVNMKAIGESINGEIYNVNTSNQLSCMLIKFENILKMQGTRGNLALGFSKDTLSPELIATISNKNIHSNKNIEYIETENDFKDFSCNYEELLNMDSEETNTELVMFRNIDLASLKPSYILYISYKDLQSESEKRNIEVCKEKMKEAGLDVPLVIFDTYTMNKKIKEKENEER